MRRGQEFCDVNILQKYECPSKWSKNERDIFDCVEERLIIEFFMENI